MRVQYFKYASSRQPEKTITIGQKGNWFFIPKLGDDPFNLFFSIEEIEVYLEDKLSLITYTR